MLYLMIQTYATLSVRNVLKIHRSAFYGTPGICTSTICISKKSIAKITTCISCYYLASFIDCVCYLLCFGGGGGGGALPLYCVSSMWRGRDPHFQPKISFPLHIIFTNGKNVSFQSNHHFSIAKQILHFFVVLETIVFKIYFPSNRNCFNTLQFSPPAWGQPECCSQTPIHGQRMRISDNITMFPNNISSRGPNFHARANELWSPPSVPFFFYFAVAYA